MDHFLVGIFIRRKVRFMAQVAALPAAGPVDLLAGRRVPGPPRRTRRRGVRHRRGDPRARRRRRDVPGGRPLAHRHAGRARQAGDRPARARQRRPGRADRDPRLLADPQLEAAAFSRRQGPLRRADALRAPSRTRHASASSRSPTRSSRASASSTREQAARCSTSRRARSASQCPARRDRLQSRQATSRRQLRGTARARGRRARRAARVAAGAVAAVGDRRADACGRAAARGPGRGLGSRARARARDRPRRRARSARSASTARLHNTSLHVTPAGEIRSAYRKIHMFDVVVGRHRVPRVRRRTRPVRRSWCRRPTRVSRWA